jgi:hypothetical protein
MTKSARKKLTPRSRLRQKVLHLAGTYLTLIAYIVLMISELNESPRWSQRVAFTTWSVRTWKNKPGLK